MGEENKKKILVIDDGKSDRKIIAETLNEYEILEAVSGQEGLDVLKNKQPDLVLIDQRMSEMDGLTTLQEIKKINTDIKIIMVTAEDNTELAVKAIKTGCCDFIIKPFRPECLKCAVDQNLAYTDKIKEEKNQLEKKLVDYKEKFGEL